MRKTLAQGSYVKVVDQSLVYDAMDDVAKRLGSSDKLHGSKVLNGMAGEVMGIEEGYVLIDFGTFEELLDETAVQKEKRPEEIALLLKFNRTGQIEEFSSEDELQSRIKKLISEGHVKTDDEFKVYSISKMRNLKVQLDIFLD